EVKQGRQVVELIFKIASKKKAKQNEVKKNHDSEKILKESQENFLNELNRKAINYQIDIELFNTIDQIASKIYTAKQKEKEILNLIEYTNTNATKNYIGLLLHILKEKEKIYKKEGNPSIVENELNINLTSPEAIPEWFETRKNNKSEKEEEELEEEEMQELKELLAKHSSVSINS